ncbi:MAG: hypothetical protein V1835_07150 [Candidatus Micrarchaeota archaeon]
MAETALTTEQVFVMRTHAADAVGREILHFFLDRKVSAIDNGNREWKELLQIHGERARRIMDDFVLQGIFTKKDARIEIRQNAQEFAKELLKVK